MTDKTNLTHIAIIMDGNRRWARKNGLPDVKGHEAGAKTLEKIVYAAKSHGIEILTVYALSTENLQKRAERELKGIFDLLKYAFSNKFKDMSKHGVRVEMFGNLSKLPESIQQIAQKLKDTYIENESIKLNIALNYGGHDEIVHVIQDLVKEGIKLDDINEKIIEKHLYLKETHPPQMVIRTGGNFRLSNFLLWQTAYSELYFTDTLWPDFDEKKLEEAINWYKEQERRFGK
ncbi:MAG: polyprenyl diphosphate synthase [Patescibacteria group bacterium]